jgi:hypothetical protein
MRPQPPERPVKTPVIEGVTALVTARSGFRRDFHWSEPSDSFGVRLHWGQPMARLDGRDRDPLVDCRHVSLPNLRVGEP